MKFTEKTRPQSFGVAGSSGAPKFDLKLLAWLLALTATAISLSPAAVASDTGLDSLGYRNEVVAEPYLPDPIYDGGLYEDDVYTINGTHPVVTKMVRLANGDVIIACVTFSEGSNAANLYLTRRNAAGDRQTWANPGTYGAFDSYYVVYPNIFSAGQLDKGVNDVRDIKAYGDRIFILIDHLSNSGSGSMDSRVLVFTTDGQYLATSTAFGSSDPEYGGGLVVYDNQQLPTVTTLLTVASTLTNGVWRPTFRKGTVNSDGSITFETAVFPNPGNYCPTYRGCILRSISTGGGSGIGAPSRFYLGGTRQASGSNWDYLVMSVSSSGSPNTSFNGSGVTVVAFDDGGDDYDDANSVVVIPGRFGASDQIYLSGAVERLCKNGIGIAKLTQAGDIDTSFGDLDLATGRTGKTIVGGVHPPLGNGCNSVFTSTTDIGNAAALSDDGSKLAIAGIAVTPYFGVCLPGDPCPEDAVDGELVVLDAGSGELKSFRHYPYSDYVGGPRTRHSGFWDITASTNGTFTATGDVRFFQSAPGDPPDYQRYATLRLRSDRLFASGFGNSD